MAACTDSPAGTPQSAALRPAEERAAAEAERVAPVLCSSPSAVAAAVEEEAGAAPCSTPAAEGAGEAAVVVVVEAGHDDAVAEEAAEVAGNVPGTRRGVAGSVRGTHGHAGAAVPSPGTSLRAEVAEVEAAVVLAVALALARGPPSGAPGAVAEERP